jgi:transposase
MKKRLQLVTDAQWEVVAPLLPEPKCRREDHRGRPWISNRACFEGILWVLRTGAAWHFLPEDYPSPATCWRRRQPWEEQGVWLEAWRALLGVLDEAGLLAWDECFLDGSFVPAKNVWSAARWQAKSWWRVIAVCANVSGLRVESKLLAIMESARHWPKKGAELLKVLIFAQA